MTKLLVTLQVGNFPSVDDISVAINLDEIRARDVVQQLDLPNSSPGWMCTDTVTIRRTLGSRIEVAKQLTDAIVKALGSRDLIDGYQQSGETA